MRLAFMGTPPFAVPALLALHGAGHEIACVYTQQPRPAGRGQRLRPSAVQDAAERLGLPVRAPTRLRHDPDADAAFLALGLDAAVVAAYGLILPQAMLDGPRLGCLNIHASLLPRWRGAGPIQAAILAGDPMTGITIMQMEAGLDTGPTLGRGVVPIGPRDDAGTLTERLAEMGAALIVEALDHRVEPVAQDDALACTAPMLSRADGRLDWRQDSCAIDRRVRAMHPWPGAFATLGSAPDGVVLKLVEVTPLPDQPHAAAPGTVLDDRLAVACGGGGAVRIDRLQWPGRAAMDAAPFLRGRPLPPGTVFG